MKFDDLIHNVAPNAADHRALATGGALFYIALVGGMICTIVNLAHGEEWQGPTRIASASGLRPIALDEAAAYSWTPAAQSATCNAQNWIESESDPVKRRAVHKMQAARNALANLVWAPPGTAIAYDPQASTSQEADLALRATTSISAAGGSTLAAR
jgi:hypothetical protein